MTILEIERQISKLKNIIEILNTQPNSIECLIFMKYIEFESVKKLQNYLKENNIKTQRDTFYTTNELSLLLNNSNSGINPEIVNLAQNIFSRNKKVIDKAYN